MVCNRADFAGWAPSRMFIYGHWESISGGLSFSCGAAHCGGGYISIFWEIFATSGKVLILLGRANSMKF